MVQCCFTRPAAGTERKLILKTETVQVFPIPSLGYGVEGGFFSIMQTWQQINAENMCCVILLSIIGERRKQFNLDHVSCTEYSPGGGEDEAGEMEEYVQVERMKRSLETWVWNSATSSAERAAGSRHSRYCMCDSSNPAELSHLLPVTGRGQKTEPGLGSRPFSA